METFFWLLRKLDYEFGRVTTHLDSSSWVVIGFAALVIGLIILRGNVLRAS